MAGKIKKIIDTIIEYKSQGNSSIERLVKTKMSLRGVNPDDFNSYSEDDSAVIAKLEIMAKEYNVKIN